MISKKKKVFILVGMVALLVATGVLNIYLNKDDTENVYGGGGVLQYSFFDTYQADRLATRDHTILYYDAIIDNANTPEEERATATNAKIEVLGHMMIESTLETQIGALGYDEVVITSSDSFVTIILKTDQLTEAQVAEILSITLSETTKTASNVRIIPVK